MHFKKPRIRDPNTYEDNGKISSEVRTLIEETFEEKALDFKLHL